MIRSSLTYNVLRDIFTQRFYRVVAIIGGLGYALLYAVASGMVIYYPESIAPRMYDAGLPLPYLSFLFVGPPDWRNPSIIWFPSGNFELVLYLGPLISTVALSSLAGINITLLVHRLRVKSIAKNQMRYRGFLAFVPTLLAGNTCGCSVTIGSLLFGAIIPSALLFTIQYTYGWSISMVIGLFMLISVVYSSRRLSGSCCVTNEFSGNVNNKQV